MGHFNDSIGQGCSASLIVFPEWFVKGLSGEMLVRWIA